MPEQTDIMILHLPVKAKWYDMQESGEKPEEYREITPYWLMRIFEINDDEVTGNYGPISEKQAEDICSHPDCLALLREAIECYEIRPRHTHVLFRYGYTRRTFLHRIDSITVGRGNPVWGAP